MAADSVSSMGTQENGMPFSFTIAIYRSATSPCSTLDLERLMEIGRSSAPSSIFLLCTLLKAKEYYAVPDVVYRYNGTHSNKRITLACTKDYLRGLIAELKLSKKKDLPEIHTLCCDRLMREADFYAQRFLKTEDPELLALLLEANAAVSPQLLKDLPEDGSVILPALRTIWHAGCRYLRWRDQRIIRTLCDVFVK